MPQKLQTNEAARAPQSHGATAKTPADAQARVQLMDFTSRRSPVMGTRGMVASSQPLASEVRNNCYEIVPHAVGAGVSDQNVCTILVCVSLKKNKPGGHSVSAHKPPRLGHPP